MRTIILTKKHAEKLQEFFCCRIMPERLHIFGSDEQFAPPDIHNENKDISVKFDGSEDKFLKTIGILNP